MADKVRQRIRRPATSEEKAAHEQLRAEVELERSELEDWARRAAQQNANRIPVGTVFSADESKVIQAIDDYAVRHQLKGRGAVVREALAQLLQVEVVRQ